MSHASCECASPFVLFPFPTEKKNPQGRLAWIKAVYRTDPNTGKNWIPTADDRICSTHFVDLKPTDANPNPTVNLGHRGMLNLLFFH
jgi:hypothetical protein